MGKITIYNLAKELETTAATVSRAFHDSPRISPKMKQAVWDLAKRWDYQPDSAAHQLRTGRSSVIGVIVPRIDRHFFASVICGIESVVHRAGYSVIVAQSNEHQADERAAISTMMAKKVDGMAMSLAAESVSYEHLTSLLGSNIPTVFFDRVPRGLEVSTVNINDHDISQRAVQHLIDQGCRRIAHLAGPQGISVYNQRQEGYLNALDRNGIALDESLIFADSITTETGIAAAEKILSMQSRPDAVFAAGDYSAIGLMQRLKERGVSIPQEMAVIGYANEPFDEMVEPSLTSIDQSNMTLGETVASMILRQIETPIDNRTHEQITMDAHLIVRGSSVRKENQTRQQ